VRAVVWLMRAGFGIRVAHGFASQASVLCFTCFHGVAICFVSLNDSFHRVAPLCMRFHFNTCKEPAMPKLTETFASKLSHPESGTRKYWDTEVKGFGLFAGKQSKTWYFQRDVGGQTRRILIGRFPVISSAAARQAAQSLALDGSRGVGKVYQAGAPTLEAAIEAYLARPKLRSQTGKDSLRSQLHKHLRDWLPLPLDQITKGMVVARHAELRAIPSGANHALRQFRSVWNHARRTHDLPEAPTLAIEWYRKEPANRQKLPSPQSCESSPSSRTPSSLTAENGPRAPIDQCGSYSPRDSRRRSWCSR
jgi:hypothetical protein